jgi:hypothetical protein
VLLINLFELLESFAKLSVISFERPKHLLNLNMLPQRDRVKHTFLITDILQKNGNSIRDDSIKDASITDGKKDKKS